MRGLLYVSLRAVSRVSRRVFHWTALPSPAPLPCLLGAQMWPDGVSLVPALSVSGSYPCTQVKTPLGDDQVATHRARFWRYPDGGWELLAVRMPSEVRDCTRPVMSSRADLIIIIPQTATVIKLPRSQCPALALCNQIMNRAGNAKRAATKCRRLARFNSMRYMTTLTFPDSVPGDRRTRCRLFQRWIERSTGRCLFRAGYIMFPEPHKSGRTHLHVLHSNRLHAGVVRGFWTDYLLRCGFTLPAGTNSVRTHQKDWGNAADAAAYASKYVSKDFSGNSREHGHRRYYPSLGLVDGSVLLVSPPLTEVIARFGRVAVRAFSAPDDFVQWFYCGGFRKPPDLSAWLPWESVN